MKYDSTGMFHWSPAKNLEDCILVKEELSFFGNSVILLNFGFLGSKSSGYDCA